MSYPKQGDPSRGPWTLCPPDPEGNAQIESPHVMVGEVYAVEEPEGAANARLIASAPDLLARIAELEAENRQLCVFGAEPTDEEWIALRAKVAELEAEVERLRGSSGDPPPPNVVLYPPEEP